MQSGACLLINNRVSLTRYSRRTSVGDRDFVLWSTYIKVHCVLKRFSAKKGKKENQSMITKMENKTKYSLDKLFLTFKEYNTGVNRK